MTTEDGRQTARCRRRPPPPALERVDQQQRWLATAAVGLAGATTMPPEFLDTWYGLPGSPHVPSSVCAHLLAYIADDWGT